jgi:hypothetical protein
MITRRKFIQNVIASGGVLFASGFLGACGASLLPSFNPNSPTLPSLEWRIIYNDDGTDVGAGDLDDDIATNQKAFTDKYLERLTGTQVDLVVYDPIMTDMFVNYQSEFLQDYGDVRDELVDNPGSILTSQMDDPFQTALSFCHGNNIDFFASFRMNDTHDTLEADGLAYIPSECPGNKVPLTPNIGLPNYITASPGYRPTPPFGRDYIFETFDPNFSKWKAYNQHLLLGSYCMQREFLNQSSSVDDAKLDVKYWWTAKNFAEQDVRDRMFEMIQEICWNYNVDGIELDFLRSPIFFAECLEIDTYTGNFKKATQEHINLMTQFVAKIREMTSRVAKQRRRTLKVAIRVPENVILSRNIGLDIETWLKNKLFDVLIVSGGYTPLAMMPAIREMVLFAAPFNVPVYGCINWSGLDTVPGNPNQWRAAAMNILSTGAGVYLFNFFPIFSDENITKADNFELLIPDTLLKQLGTINDLKGTDKAYGIDKVEHGSLQGDIRPGVYAPDRLPKRLIPAPQSTHFRLPVGENIGRNRTSNRTCQARLLINIRSVDPNVSVNNQPIKVYINSESANEPPHIIGSCNIDRTTPNHDYADIQFTGTNTISLKGVFTIEDPSVIRKGVNRIDIEACVSNEKMFEIDKLELIVEYV